MPESQVALQVQFAAMDAGDGSDPRERGLAILRRERVLSALRDASAPWTDQEEAVLLIPVTDDGHVVALEQAVLAGFSTAKPCTHKTRRPPSVAAVREAARLRGVPENDPAQKVVIDLAVYAATAARLSVVPHHDPIEQE